MAERRKLHATRVVHEAVDRMVGWQELQLAIGIELCDLATESGVELAVADDTVDQQHAAVIEVFPQPAARCIAEGEIALAAHEQDREAVDVGCRGIDGNALEL